MPVSPRGPGGPRNVRPPMGGPRAPMGGPSGGYGSGKGFSGGGGLQGSMPRNLTEKRAKGRNFGIIGAIIITIIMILPMVIFPDISDYLPISFVKQIAQLWVVIKGSAFLVIELFTAVFVLRYYYIDYFPRTWGGRMGHLKMLLSPKLRKSAFYSAFGWIALTAGIISIFACIPGLIYLFGNYFVFRHVFLNYHA